MGEIKLGCSNCMKHYSKKSSEAASKQWETVQGGLVKSDPVQKGNGGFRAMWLPFF